MYGTPILYTVLGSTSQTVTISSIPSSYKHLYFVWGCRTTDTIHGPQARWSWNNNDISNGANWSVYGTESTSTVQRESYGPESNFRQRSIMRDDNNSGLYTWYRNFIPNYANSNVNKMMLSQDLGIFGLISNTLSQHIMVNPLNTTTNLSSITLSTNQGPYKAGSIFILYGIN